MAEFTPITTQEAFDAAIQDRLHRQEAKIRGEYADYDALKKQSEEWGAEKEKYEKTVQDSKTAYDDLTKKYTEATGKIAKFETDALKTKVAIEAGIPAGLFSYLKGENEDEIRKSAEELAQFTKAGFVPPLADPEEEPPKDTKDAAYLKMAKALSKK